jgi:hypothetical protein
VSVCVVVCVYLMVHITDHLLPWHESGDFYRAVIQMKHLYFFCSAILEHVHHVPVVCGGCNQHDGHIWLKNLHNIYYIYNIII